MAKLALGERSGGTVEQFHDPGSGVAVGFGLLAGRGLLEAQEGAVPLGREVEFDVVPGGSGAVFDTHEDLPAAVFHFAPSRAHHHVERFLGDFKGTLVTDGYGAYAEYAGKRGDAVRLQNCWTHTRRNFEEQLDNYPVLAGEALDLIGGMYGIEKKFRSRPPPELLVARRTHTRPLVDAFWLWCEQTLEDPALTPKHPIRQALNYAVERRQSLEVFLDDPLVPIDTNGVERALRRIKLGQKNWLFSWTESGAHNVGIVNSLVATCQLLEISPLVYLTDVLQRIDTHPADRIHELTPRLWKELFADAPMTGSIALSGVRAHPDATRGPS